MRTHAAARHAMPPGDEEHFRLITGFNDIFVTIAAVMILVPLGPRGEISFLLDRNKVATADGEGENSA